MSEISYEKLLENLFDGVYYVDMERKITFWNSAAERITGFGKKEIKGHFCADNILRHIDETGKNLCLSGCPLAETLKDGKIREINAWLHHKEGHRVPVSIRVSPVKNEKGEITGAVEIFSDNSTRLQILQEMEQLKSEIYTDSLTQISNRKFGEMSLGTKLYAIEQYNIPVGVIFFDVDRFKQFNDSYGHDIGDRVLIMVGKTVTNILRKLDIVCRWGGEEFVVIVSNIDRKILLKISEKIRVFIKKSFIMADNEKLTVTVSIGGTLLQREDTIETVIKRADTLMYMSKQGGRDRVTLG